MLDFKMSFDPGSLARITQLIGFKALLAPEITLALSDSGSKIVSDAQAITWQVFANPTGMLASSIYFYVVSPTEVAIGVGVPYGRRREFGFSGMTDSLGRFYPYDPAKPYAAPALDMNRESTRTRVAEGVLAAFGMVGA